MWLPETLPRIARPKFNARLTVLNTRRGIIVGDRIRNRTTRLNVMRWMMYVSAVGVFTVSSSPAQVKQAAPPSVAEEQDFAFASGLYRDGLYQLAQEQLQRFSTNYPNSLKRSEASFLKNECLFFTEQYPAARAGYTQYLREYPRSSYADDAWFRTGEISLKGGKPSDAVVAFKKVMDDFAESDLAGEAAYWAGESFLGTMDFDNALKYYTLAYENYPKSRVRDYALYSLGWTQQKKSSFPPAVQTYKKFLDEFPTSTLASSARIRIGECAFYAKDYRRAIDDLTQARPLISDSTERGEADYLIADAYYRLGDFSSAERLFREFLTAYPKHGFARDAAFSLGWSLLKLNKSDSAQTMFARLASGNDDIGHAALFRTGALQKNAGKLEEAGKTFHALLSRDSVGEFSDNAFYELGLLSYDASQYAQALQNFDRASGYGESSEVLGDALRMAGESLVMLERFSDARVRFERALERKDLPFDSKVAAAFQRGWCSLKLKEFGKAIEQFKSFVAEFPNHPKTAEANFWMGEAEYARGNFPAAIAAYKLVAVSSPKNPGALYGIGWSYFKQGGFSSAITAFEQFIATYPTNPFAFDARLRLGDCYYNQKDYKKAAASFRTVLRLYPDSSAADYAAYQAGQALFRGGDVSGAYQQFEELVKKSPDSPLADDAQYALGWVNFQRKDFTEAIKEFQKTAKNYPASDNAARALYSLGDCYYNLKQFLAAERSYREVLNRFPESKFVPDAVTGIQYCLVAQGKQQQALEVIDDFLKEHPGSTIAEDLSLRKVELLFNQDDFAGAAKECKSFAAQFPKSKQLPTSVQWLARCYRAQANNDEAAQTYERLALMESAVEQVRAEAFLEAAVSYESLKRLDKVVSVFERGEQSIQDSKLAAGIHARHGDFFARTGKPGDALAQFNRTIQISVVGDASDRARVGIATIKIGLQDFEAARVAAEQVATSRTDALGAEAQFIAGRAYVGQNELTKAITAFLRLRYIFPSHEIWVGKANLELGDVYVSQKEYAKARESYNAALNLKNQQEISAEAQKRLKNVERL